MMWVGCIRRQLASDYDLGDNMTKKRLNYRLGLIKYFEHLVW